LSGVVIYPLAEHWDDIVQLYTDANLTRAEDKLVAISAVAKQILKGTDDVYFAGLWRSAFTRGLLWYLPLQQSRIPTAYRAPSWSWASVDGRVEFMVRRPDGADGADTTPIVVSKIHTISTTGLDSKRASTGQIEDGFCRISGPLRTNMRYSKQGYKHQLILSDGFSVEFFPDTILKNDPADLACLPLLYYNNISLKNENKYPKKWLNMLAGLVIQPTGEFRDEYCRLGVFRISEENGKVCFREPDVGRKEVTII
jgi:hypothetical protein